jgi:hypothetical protein
VPGFGRVLFGGSVFGCAFCGAVLSDFGQPIRGWGYHLVGDTALFLAFGRPLDEHLGAHSAECFCRHKRFGFAGLKQRPLMVVGVTDEAQQREVLRVPDHLGAPALFPALMSAAEVTTFRLDTFVLNAGFDKPALLARDVAGVDLLTDGRFEFGLGASTALSPRTDSSSLRHL